MGLDETSGRPGSVVARRCRHAFETLCLHANGDLVCSILDGRGDFVLGNAYEQSVDAVFHGPRYEELRRLVLSTTDGYCPAIGKRCPLKSVPVHASDAPIASRIRFLQIEPTTACDLRCLACPVRDFSPRITWRDALRDGGVRFALWDGARRSKQHVADAVRHALPRLAATEPSQRGRLGRLLLRGRVPRTRTGTLPLEVVQRVVTQAGPGIERVDFYNYGEPFLYGHLVEALCHVRATLPAATIALSTDGMPVRERIQDTLVRERLVDWVVFSIDGADARSYARYRVGGRFETALQHLVRFHRCAEGTDIQVVWQYVVFRWNDGDEQLREALTLAERLGIRIWFDFARTWGRSRRRAADLGYLVPYLKPETSFLR